MKKIALTAAALLIAAGSAYAGSGRSIQVPGNDLSQPAIDSTTTSSVAKTLLNGGSADKADQTKANQSGYGPGMWGNH